MDLEQFELQSLSMLKCIPSDPLSLSLLISFFHNYYGEAATICYIHFWASTVPLFPTSSPWGPLTHRNFTYFKTLPSSGLLLYRAASENKQKRDTNFEIVERAVDTISQLVCLFVFVTPEGFTTVVANEGLEKERAYLNQVPRDRRLYIPSEGCGVNFRWKHLRTTPVYFTIHTQDENTCDLVICDWSNPVQVLKMSGYLTESHKPFPEMRAFYYHTLWSQGCIRTRGTSLYLLCQPMFSHSLWFIITHLLSHVAIYKAVSTGTQEVLCDGRAGARPQLSPFQLKECTGRLFVYIQ